MMNKIANTMNILCWLVGLVLFINTDQYLSIYTKYANIDNVGYNISIGTYYSTDTTLLSSIKTMFKICFSYHFW